MPANPLALLRRFAALLLSLAWRLWNFVVGLNDNDWLAVSSDRRPLTERLFNTSVRAESLSLPWTLEMTELPGDTLEFTCTYNSSPDSGLSDIQIDRVAAMRSIGVAEFYSQCLDNWPGFLRQWTDRVTQLDWSEDPGRRTVVARMPGASAGLAYSPQHYPIVAFADGWSCCDDDDGGGRRLRCCLAAVVHLPLAPGQPHAQILRRFFLRWPPEAEADEAAWRPRLVELRPYFDSSGGGGGDDGGCAVCQSAPAQILLLPCRHACLCAQCASRLQSDLCPLCRRLVLSRMTLGSGREPDGEDSCPES